MQACVCVCVFMYGVAEAGVVGGGMCVHMCGYQTQLVQLMYQFECDELKFATAGPFKI